MEGGYYSHEVVRVLVDHDYIRQVNKHFSCSVRQGLVIRVSPTRTKCVRCLLEMYPCIYMTETLLSASVLSLFSSVFLLVF